MLMDKIRKLELEKEKLCVSSAKLIFALRQENAYLRKYINEITTIGKRIENDLGVLEAQKDRISEAMLKGVIREIKKTN